MEFTPEQKVLNDLFGSDLTYIIPSYQRPYSWSSKGKSDKDNQVNIMWQDLIEHFDSDNPNIYFMGSMVLIGNGSKRQFQVVDGQQRLITISLLFVSIKCMLAQIEDGQIEKRHFKPLKDFIKNALENINLLLFNRKLFGILEQEKKVKIQSLAGFNYDNVLKMALECGHLTQLKANNISEEQEKVSKRYFENRDFFIQKLQEHFLDSNAFTLAKALKLNEFVDFLKNKVTIVRILSPKFEIAYQIFEILNNRGLPLSNKDLFRNFIISEMYKHQIDKPEQKWLDLDDFEFTPEFISRYVESTNARKQKYSAFNDIQDIYNELFFDEISKNKVQLFYENIKNSLVHYTNIELASFANKAIRNRVLFLKNAGNSRYIINLLLALFKNITNEQQLISFLSELEIFITYLLLGPSKRFQVKPIFQAIAHLNAKDFPKALKNITLEKNEKADLKIILQNHDIKDNDWAKLMIARYVWAKDIASPDDVVNLDLNYKSATLEHIIPQTPDKSTNWASDFSASFRKKYTYKLGNMTLLTQRMNSKAKNYDFSRKKGIYNKMKLDITTEIGKLENIDEGFIKKRHEMISSYLVRHFNL
ncbi:MAG: DUF262 domain-containing protein [Chitinophagales bacterium]